MLEVEHITDNDIKRSGKAFFEVPPLLQDNTLLPPAINTAANADLNSKSQHLTGSQVVTELLWLRWSNQSQIYRPEKGRKH